MSVSITLRHAFADFTLDAAFDAPAGLTALFGRSGSGKTTVVNAVAGLLRPDQGRISVNGTVLFDSETRHFVAPHKRRVGYVFQDARLFPHLSVRRNLTYGARFSGGVNAQEFGRITDLLGIGGVLDRGPANLSGGERQRVAIGRALLARPNLLLMDEPLAALDADRKAEILPYLEQLRDQTDVPILYVSHDLGEVARLATTLVALDAGRVVAAGPAQDLLSNPATAPALGVRAAGAVLNGRVLRHHDDGLSEIETSAGTLFLPRLAADPDAKVQVRIEAQDIILSRSRPTGLSALNILPATVTALHHGEGSGVMVQLLCGQDRLLARITRRSANALGIAPGVRCFGVVKSVAVARDDIGLKSGV